VEKIRSLNKTKNLRSGKLQNTGNSDLKVDPLAYAGDSDLKRCVYETGLKSTSTQLKRRRLLTKITLFFSFSFTYTKQFNLIFKYFFVMYNHVYFLGNNLADKSTYILFLIIILIIIIYLLSIKLISIQTYYDYNSIALKV